MEDEDEDLMDDWDEDKLAEVVAKKHGAEKTATTTDIICKYFLEERGFILTVAQMHRLV